MHHTRTIQAIKALLSQHEPSRPWLRAAISAEVGLLLAIGINIIIMHPGNALGDTPQHGSSTIAAQNLGLPRAILWIDRNRTSQGYIVNEDETIISLREQDGIVTSHAKSRLLRIIRLVEPGPGGQQGTVFLRNGEKQSGRVIKDEFDGVTMEIAGVRATFKRDIVLEVILEPSIEERYEHYLKTLDPGAYEDRLQLCQWLFDNNRFELAKQELDALLSNRELPAARKLLRVVDAQLALRKPSASPPPFATREHTPEAGVEDAGEHAATSGPVLFRDVLPKQLLTDADVNLIRVYEIDFNRPPRVTIRPETIRKLIENYSTSKLIPTSQSERTAMFRADPLALTRLIFQLRARELYGEIEVSTEPHSLNLFRQRVHNTWLMNNCATSRCHGGLEGGRFFLHRLNHKNPRVRYTNLLILERLVIDTDLPLINYNAPGDSLILQYALPRGQARKPHPDVPGWKAVFTGADSRMREDAIEWIESMMQPRPEYPVRYDPPMLGQNRGPDPGRTNPFAETGTTTEPDRMGR